MSSTKRAVKRTEAVTVTGAISTGALFELVYREVKDMPPDAQIDLFVSVPGGGDWSNTNLEIGEEHRVNFRVRWKRST